MRAGPKVDVTAGPLDLSSLPAGGGDRVIAFVHEFLRVTKGVGARGPFRLRPWQQQLVRGLFNDPRPRQGLLSIPRGNGKSSLAAALGLYGLFADGVEGAEVLVVASDERQARIVFNVARRMIELEPALEERCQIFQDRIYVPGTDSTLRPLPAEASALHGYDPSLLIVDELHVVSEGTWEACSSAAGKRAQSLSLAISTPASTAESVMWSLVEHGRAGVDPSFFFQEFGAPEGCDLDDEAAWHAANPALGDFLAIDALRAVRRTLREETFRRLRLGQWVQSDDAWLPAGAWDACTAGISLSEGAEVVLGFDGSVNLDATAIVAVSVGEKPHIEVVGLWEGVEVPIVEVEDRIRDACGRFDVKAIVADAFRWKRSLQILAAEGLPVEEFPQHAARMTPATSRFYEAVLNRELTHNGDVDLARHVRNARVTTDGRGTRVRKESKHSIERIDCAVAALMAFDAAGDYRPAPTKQPFFVRA